MPTSYVDGCVFVAASSGTGDFVVSSAATGWRTPASAGAVDAATYRYRANSLDNTQWEIGTGTYTVSSTTLARTTVASSSAGGAKVSFTVAPQVALTVFGADLDTSGTYVSIVEEFVGANTASITTTNTIASKDSTLLIVGGVPQPSSAWTLSGNTITLANSELFITGEPINVRIMKGAVSYLGVNPLYARHTGTGSAGPFTLLATPIVFNALDITVGNVPQPKDSSAYTLSGNQITFTEVVPVGTFWDELILQPLGISTVADGTVTNTKLATMAANTIKGSVSGGAPVDLTPAQAMTILTDYFAGPIGQCRFVYINSTTCQLQPYGGDRIKINGIVYAVPSTGVNIISNALTAATVYNIYAYMVGTTMTLEASATGHVPDTTAGNVGVEIKSGDPTRTLVGKVLPIAGTPNFADSASQRYVISWFNRKPISCILGSSTSYSSASTTFAELSSTLRAQFISWGDAVTASISGVMYNASASTMWAGIALDGTAPQNITGSAEGTGAAALPMVVSGTFLVTEGSHYITPVVRTSTGTLLTDATNAPNYLTLLTQG